MENKKLKLIQVRPDIKVDIITEENFPPCKMSFIKVSSLVPLLEDTLPSRKLPL